MTSAPFYDGFSQDYDRFVDWDSRLSFELPFFRALFERCDVRRVLDVACGTGQHAIAFAREGYEVTATDISQAMVDRAQHNVAEAGVRVPVLRLGFGQLAGAVEGVYEAITCLGNSLPHLTTRKALGLALRDFARVLAPGGLLIIQNRNFDRVLAQHERFMLPQVCHAGDEEWIFLRFYDFAGERLRFNVVRLYRRGDGEWSSRIGRTELRAWRYETLRQALNEAGLPVSAAYGSYRGEVFDPSESGDLVLVAERTSTT